jgi:hypothetical protein
LLAWLKLTGCFVGDKPSSALHAASLTSTEGCAFYPAHLRCSLS